MDTKKSDTTQLRTGFKRLSISTSLGVYEEEYHKKQTIWVSVSLSYPAHRIRLLNSEDRFEHVFDYAGAADMAKQICDSAHHEVIEHLALLILTRMQKEFPDSQKITVLIEKTEAVPGSEGSFCEVEYQA